MIRLKEVYRLGVGVTLERPIAPWLTIAYLESYSRIVRLVQRLASPHRLARPRTSPFHGGNGGSNPPGDANLKLISASATEPSHRHEDPALNDPLVEVELE